MPEAVALEEPLARLLEVLNEQGPKLVIAASVLAGAGLLLAPQSLGIAAVASGAALAALALFGKALSYATRGARGTIARQVRRFTENDPAPCFAVSRSGEVWYQNPAAQKRFQSGDGCSLARALGDVFANPSSVLHRLQDKAAAIGSALEDVVTRRGHVRLTVLDIGRQGFLWRIEEVVEVGTPARGPEAMQLPLLIVAKTGTVLYSNDGMRQILGRKVKHVDRVVTDLPLRSGGIHEIMTEAGTQRFRVVVNEGAAERRELYFLPADEDGAARETNGTTDTEDLPVGILQLRGDGTIAGANRLARELLCQDGGGALEGDMLSEHLEGLGRPVRDWLDEAMKGRGLGKPEVLRVSAPDTEAYLQVTLGAMPGRGDVKLNAILNDATELKTLEGQFVQSQKMQAIGQLAGGVAHDFNNLLTAISGHCDLMLLRHDQGDPDYGDLVQIHQNANRAASLVGQLLAFSRKQTLQPQVIDLRDTLSDLTHLLSRLVGERITLTLHHEVGLPSIRADRRQLEQVIMNLVVNARDAMPEGGEIRVETMERILGDGLTRDRAKVPPGRYVVVKVEDHGTGIPADKIGKIFEPFYTTKRTGEGTGLGLSTAYGIVKQSGGFIFVDSVPGVGTVFTLYFPAYDGPVEVMEVPLRAAVGMPAPSAEPHGMPPARASAGRVGPVVAHMSSVPGGTSASALPVAVGAIQQAAPPPERPHLVQEPQIEGGAVILLVEDEAPVRAFASRALRMRGHTVIEAENAEEALATLKDASLHVDVFVTDVIMPGLDGPTWVRMALETRPDVKVIFVSGYAEDSFSEEQSRIPNSVFLPKPFSLSELTATVQDQLS